MPHVAAVAAGARLLDSARPAGELAGVVGHDDARPAARMALDSRGRLDIHPAAGLAPGPGAAPMHPREVYQGGPARPCADAAAYQGGTPPGGGQWIGGQYPDTSTAAGCAAWLRASADGTLGGEPAATVATVHGTAPTTQESTSPVAWRWPCWCCWPARTGRLADAEAGPVSYRRGLRRRDRRAVLGAVAAGAALAAAVHVSGHAGRASAPITAQAVSAPAGAVSVSGNVALGQHLADAYGWGAGCSGAA